MENSKFLFFAPAFLPTYKQHFALYGQKKRLKIDFEIFTPAKS